MHSEDPMNRPFSIMIATMLGCLAFSAAAAQEPVALWAFPDAMPVSQTVRLGVVAYHHAGVSNVVFTANGAPAGIVAEETMNPDTGEMEFVLELDTTGYAENALVNIDAAVYSTDPASPPNTLGTRTVCIDNVPTTDIRYVDEALGSDSTGTGASNAPFATIQKALTSVSSGGEIRVRDGEYHFWADINQGFNRFVHVHPDAGASPVITSATTFDISFLHMEGFEFDWTGVARSAPDNQIADGQGIIKAGSINHFWVEDCELHSVPDIYNNYLSAIRVLSATDVLIEGCRIHHLDLAIGGSPSGAIYRGNEIGPITRDAFDFFSDTLITGNAMHDIRTQPLYIVTANSEPFNFPMGSDLTFHYRELNGGSWTDYHFADLSSALSNPTSATAQEVADALMDDPGFSGKIVSTATNGQVRVRPKRTNHKQELWVEGGANDGLGFPNDSYENRAWGSGQHSDIFQTWGAAQSNVVIRNNRAYDGAFQGLLPQSNIRNMVLVNNLFDGEIDTSWMLYFEFQPTGRNLHYENILLANNTFWGAWRTVWAAIETNCTDFAIINNIFGPRSRFGDLSHTGVTVADYNLYDYFAPGSGEGSAAHSLWTNTESNTPTQTPLFTTNVTTYWKAKDWMFSLTGFDPGVSGYWQYIAPNGEFSLASNSPARNAGTDAAGIAYDINWFPRDYAPDIGAFEYPRTDMDADSLPDDWEIHFFSDLETSDGTGDEDTDGPTDREEEIAGTDPIDSNSVFAVGGEGMQPGGGFIIQWPSAAGRLYSVDSRSNLLAGSWGNIESNIVATPPMNTYTAQTDSAEVFFNRVGVRKQ